ncbi:toxic anion resistance protein [Fervidibacillus halotolerans]|uniref:Toxic anion resistance protein n=1 Tax=Fervidibacillus halotolerans TaxID=2980027 RepID=A0A9E8LZA3_9BACI|nr:toxic anion resistance protein [Fervidibacillus halotolerans]WAA12548.1 toxic anion resistance protein [Fervidibacillus halotolerans]
MSETNERFSTDIDDLLENPFDDEEFQLAEVKDTNIEQRPKKLIDTLPEASKERAFKIAEQLDPKNHEIITLFGTKAQSKLTNFSHSMLDHVKNKNIGDIGHILNELMSKLEQVNPDELQPEKRGFFSKVFGKVSRSVNEILTKYQKTGAQIDRITVKLEHCKNTLMSDNTLLDQLYEKNKDYFRALNIYIAAGELKIEELRTKTIPQMKKKAEESGDQMAYQEVNDMVQFTERLERRVHDLKLSRQITIQSAPQIRLIQNTNQQLIEKIQSSIMTAIPLWKNQIAIALTLIRQRKAVEAQKQVSQTTNDLLLKNAEMLKANSVETAKENERGLVDIETLKKTQEYLISTLEETLKIQAEGRAKRYQAEQELMSMENQLKQKLLDLKN